MWKETVFTKSPYQEFTDHLAKNHKGQPKAKLEAWDQLPVDGQNTVRRIDSHVAAM